MRQRSLAAGAAYRTPGITFLETAGPGVRSAWRTPLTIASVLAAVLLRAVLVPRGLPYYSIDENEIVDPALMVVAGDWDPRWFAYGPLTRTILAGLFWAWRWVAWIALDWGWRDFWHAAFFAPTSFYVIARALHVAVILGIAWTSFRFARRFFGPASSVAALVLGLAPFLDRNADFTVRLDTVQGLLGLWALYAATVLLHSRRTAGAALTGALAGLALAVKPLQGLLLLPPILLAAAVATARPGGSRARAFAFAPGPWVLLAAALAAHTLVHPHSVLAGRAFLAENAAWLSRAGTANTAVLTGYELGWLVDLGGWPLALGAGLALVACLRHSDRATRLLLVSVAAFCVPYFFTRVRPYWYNAVLPLVFLLVARAVGELAERLAAERARAVAGLLALFLAAPVVAATAREAWAAVFPVPLIERRADRAAELWIEANVPSGGTLLAIGSYSADLPRIVGATSEEHAEWAEVLMYGRGQSQPFVEAFRFAYRTYRRSGEPRYQVRKIRRPYSDRLDPVRSQAMNEDIPVIAHAEGAGYIVTASPHEFHGAWEAGPAVERIARFGPSTGHVGHEVQVFRLSPHLLGGPGATRR